MSSARPAAAGESGEPAATRTGAAVQLSEAAERLRI